MMGLKEELTTKGNYHVRCLMPLLIPVIAAIVAWVMTIFAILPNIMVYVMGAAYIGIGVLLFIRKSSTLFSKITACLAAVYGLVVLLGCFANFTWLLTVMNWVFVLYLASIVITNDFYLPLRGIQLVALIVSLLMMFTKIISWTWLPAALEALFLGCWIFLSFQSEQKFAKK